MRSNCAQYYLLLNYLLLKALACFILLLSGIASAEYHEHIDSAALTNHYCPVWEGREAKAEFFSVYKGQKIHFCCADCQQVFNTDPEAYLQNLPSEHRPSALYWLPEIEGFTFLLNPLAILVIALVGVLFITVRIFKKGTASLGKASSSPVLLLSNTVLVGLLVGVGYKCWDYYYQLDYINRQHLIHYTTFYDYGYPPRPSKPPVAKRLTASFYRGNDERDSKLFNGGNYLTSTFHISLRAEKLDQALSFDDEVADQALFLRYEIERAPYTPDFFFDDRQISKVFLTKKMAVFLGKDKAVSDAIKLSTIENLQRWEALFPIGQVEAKGKQSLSGIVYVAEKRKEHGKMIGSRFHYGIQYDLHFKDGKILPESDLWMGSLYRTRKASLANLPVSEWFSHKPIPPLPREQVQDSKLLGLDDYAGG